MDEPVTVHAQTGIPWQKRYLAAIVEGLGEVGIGARWTAQQETGPGTHIILGPNAFRTAYHQLSQAGRDLITVNRAFIGSVLGDEPDPYVAIGWNGYNNRARFPFAYGDTLPMSRMTKELWDDVGEPQSSRQSGLPLILGEYENTQGYLAAAITQCRRRGGGFFYRPHPHGPTPTGVQRAPWETIETAVDASSVCLTHHSTAGVLALIRGCPVVTYDRESMAWPITEHELAPDRIPAVPERGPWLEWLAWTQWKISEIARGDPWEWFE